MAHKVTRSFKPFYRGKLASMDKGLALLLTVEAVFDE